MADFDERLRKAIVRGSERAEKEEEEARKEAMSVDELKTLHGKFRLQLSEHIEKCVGSLPHHFPGFRTEVLFGERGWGAACSRDDFESRNGGRANVYSRLEITVRSFSDLHVLDLSAKGTIRDKEVLRRSYFKKIHEVDIDAFMEMIDNWSIEYAEKFAAAS